METRKNYSTNAIFMKSVGYFLENNNTACAFYDDKMKNQNVEIMRCVKANSTEYIVESICPYGFADTDIQKISLPNTITKLSNYSFANSKISKPIRLPVTLGYIGDYAFSGCGSFKVDIRLPLSIVEVGKGAFSNSGIKSFITGSSLRSIDDYLLSGCEYLRKVIIGVNVSHISTNAFSGCKNIEYFITSRYNKYFAVKNSILCNKNFSRIIKAPQKNANYTSMEDFGDAKVIEEYAFENCDINRAIYIPDSVTKIGSFAFNNCSMTKLYIGSFCSSIDANSIICCPNLVDIELSKSNNHFKVQNGALFSKQMKILYVWPASRSGPIVIPDTVNTISHYALWGTIGTGSFSFLKNIEKIGHYAFYNCSLSGSLFFNPKISVVRKYTFAECHKITSVDFMDSNITVIKEGAFENCTSLWNVLSLPTDIEYSKSVFKGCDSLTYVEFDATDDEDDEASIPEEFFSGCTHLSHITLTNNIVGISRNAFFNCTSLATIYLCGVKYIEDRAFNKCSSLATVFISKHLESFTPLAFTNCHHISYVSLKPGNINPNFQTMRGIVYSNYGKKLVYFPPTRKFGDVYKLVEVFGSYCCAGSKINKVTITSEVKEIMDHAFANIPTLEVINFSLNSHLTTIGESAFSGDSALISDINIPDSVETIGCYAFSGCHKVKQIFIASNVNSIGELAFNCLGAVLISYCGNDLKISQKTTIFTSSVPVFVMKGTYEGNTFGTSKVAFVTTCGWVPYKESNEVHRYVIV